MMSDLRVVAIIKRVFDHQAFEHMDRYLPDFSELLQGPAHLSQQEPNQKVIPAEVVGQGVV